MSEFESPALSITFSTEITFKRSRSITGETCELEDVNSDLTLNVPLEAYTILFWSVKS